MSRLAALAAAVGSEDGCRQEALVGALVLSGNRPDEAFDIYFDSHDRCDTVPASMERQGGGGGVVGAMC